MGRGCQADLQVPGGGEPPPYRCAAVAHTVGRGLAPAVSFPEPPRCLQTLRTPKSVIANQRARWCGNPFPCKPQACAPRQGRDIGPGA